MVEEDKLGSLRNEIDAIDDKLLELLNRRASITKSVGDVKREAGGRVEYYRPDREAEVLSRLKNANEGPLTNKTVVSLMREIISVCLSLEKVLRVAYLGPEGTYTHAALKERFGSAVESVSCEDIPEVFKLVEADRSDYGVVPIENSSGGSVNQTLDCLSTTKAKIIGEVTIPIRHQLLSKADNLASILKIFAHDQALLQCSAWLRENLSGVELIRVSSNAAAAKKAEEGKRAAAIASMEAAEIYNLQVLASNIEDSVGNSTRFLVLGKESPRSTGADRTSVMFSTSNVAGSLYGLLEVLAEAGISMSRIESRPSGAGLWDYMFFVDFLGHSDDFSVSEAIVKMKLKCHIFKILGSYPRSVL